MPKFNCHIVETITYDCTIEAKDYEEAEEAINKFATEMDLLSLPNSDYTRNIDIDEEEE